MLVQSWLVCHRERGSASLEYTARAGEGGVMRTFKRICIKDYVLEEDGNKLELKRGTEYITSDVGDAPAFGPESQGGHVVVFSTYWATVPVEVFAGEEQF